MSRVQCHVVRRVGDTCKGIGLGLVLLALVVLMLGAWRGLSGEGLNPRYVARIKDGQTTKNEILLWFGEPQDVERSAAGVVFTYHGYADAPPPISKKLYHEPQEQSLTPFVIDENKQIKRKTVKKEGKILKNTLTVRFAPGSDIVAGHEFKEY